MGCWPTALDAAAISQPSNPKPQVGEPSPNCRVHVQPVWKFWECIGAVNIRWWVRWGHRHRTLQSSSYSDAKLLTGYDAWSEPAWAA